NGNTATCSFTVNRVDNTPPAITCPATQTLALGANCSAVLPDYSIGSSSDNCGIPTVTQVPASGTTLSGTTTVTLTANDGNGNTATCSFSVLVNDGIAPVINGCPSNQIICTPTATWTAPTATDNCSTPTLTSTANPGSLFGIGVTTVVYTATDASGNTATCSFTVSYTPLVVVTNISNYNGAGVSCNGGNNGTATATVTSGTAPFSYVWSTGATLLNTGATAFGISGLTAGTYTVTVTSADGCTQVKQVTLTQPQALNCNAAATAASCGDNNGSIQASSTGGVLPYSYSLLSGTTVVQTNASGTFTGLAPGTYSVQVTDGNGCVCSVASVTVIDAGNGGTGNALAGNVYEGIGTGNTIIPTLYNIATIEINGGVLPYSYSWTTSGYVQYSTVLNATGTGVVITVVYSDNALWSLTVTDSNNCANSQIVYDNYFNSGNTSSQILDIVSEIITPDFGVSNGSISLQVEGGTPCAGNLPYNYQWSGPSNFTGLFTNGPTQTGLISGWYIVTVTDCSANTPQVTVGWYWVPSKIRGRGKDALSNDMLQVMPNPFVQTTSIQFSWPQDDELRLEVYDLSGKIVQTLFKGIVRADEVHTINYDAANLPNGMYLCRLVNTEGWELHTKIMHLQGR
ncbi:hypothetical protein C7N43_29210, partial [Sphingobacteriales bacterium UPWRP_1]